MSPFHGDLPTGDGGPYGNRFVTYVNHLEISAAIQVRKLARGSDAASDMRDFRG